MNSEFEIWDQWHDLGFDVFEFNRCSLTNSQRKVLLKDKELSWVFSLGMSLHSDMIESRKKEANAKILGGQTEEGVRK